MKIITYVWVGNEAPPAGSDVIARIRCQMLGAKGKMVEAWHPVIIHGRDEDDARAKAQAWWDDEVAKERRKAENAAAAGARLAARKVTAA